MPNYIQELKQFSYGEEASWGTAAGTKNLWAGLAQNFAVKTKQNIKDVEYMGAGRDVGQLVKVASDTTFSFQMALQHGKIFQYVLGESVDAGAGPYTHTMDGDDSLKSLTLVYTYLDPAGATDFNKEITGAMINKVTVDIPERDVILATFEGFGKEPANSSKQTLTAANTVPFLSAHNIISIDSGGGYSSIADIKTAQFSIDNGMQVFGDMGQFDIAEPRPGARRYAVRFPRRFKSSTYWDYLVNGTEIDVKFTWTRTGGQDLASFEFRDCRLESADQSSEIKGAQEEEPVLKAKTCQIIFTDSTATY